MDDWTNVPPLLDFASQLGQVMPDDVGLGHARLFHGRLYVASQICQQTTSPGQDSMDTLTGILPTCWITPTSALRGKVTTPAHGARESLSSVC